MQNKDMDFSKIFTIYGRKPVLETLQDPNLELYKLHLSTGNKPSRIIDTIVDLAQKRDIPIAYHSPRELSFISKNSRQDQGVALDIFMPTFYQIDTFLSQNHEAYRLLVLDGITTPQNVGMILRSAAAGNIDAVIVPQKRTAKIDPLVMKASAGTLFKIPIIRCDDLLDVLKKLKHNGAKVVALDMNGSIHYQHFPYTNKTVFVLGGESEGVSQSTLNMCDASVHIPMKRNVESLNVAVAAALIAFMG